VPGNTLKSMIVGFVGAGNMAAAMARGWESAVHGPEQMLFTDSGSGRAAPLARAVGGEAVDSNVELAERSDLLVLAVKPTALKAVSRETRGARAVLSLLAATPLQRVAEAYPGSGAFRVMPNLGVAVRRGVLCFAAAEEAAAETEDEVRELLEQLGHVVQIDDAQFDGATAIMSCSAAYLALAVEAIADAGVADGLDRKLALSLVTETAAGTAELLHERDPEEVRKAVASPGGSTEAGLEALDREGAAEAFAVAVRASLARMRE
jgi:pyrroline-5-carboxylate reductase